MNHKEIELCNYVQSLVICENLYGKVIKLELVKSLMTTKYDEENSVFILNMFYIKFVLHFCYQWLS